MTTDQLTGVWNRAHIETSAKREIEMFNRYGHPFSVIFADIDHFKNVNDKWGHATGDEVIKAFCAAAQTALRSTDILGRWGGEEFVVLLPNTGRMSASLTAERMRVAISDQDIPEVGQITASIGIAVSSIGDTFESLLARADKAMYNAKEAGRNRVEIESAISLDDPGGMDDYYEVVTPNFVGLIWRSAYECGHPLIDTQHRVLFEQSNELMGAVLAGQPKDVITSQISALLAEVVQHFEDEEAIFNETEWPLAKEHHDIHQNLVAQASDLAQKYENDQLEIGGTLFLSCA